MISFAQASPFFEKLNTSLLGLSIDSNSSHLAWMHDIYCMTGIVLPFPIIADRNGTIARKYGMISSDVSNTETVRNVLKDIAREITKGKVKIEPNKNITGVCDYCSYSSVCRKNILS